MPRDRRVGGRTLSFVTIGKLRSTDLVMYDRETESWWQQFAGECIGGALLGTQIEIPPCGMNGPPRSGRVWRLEGSSMGRWREICLCCVSEGIPRRSLKVALFVGAILNLINQGDALFTGAHLDFTKIILTFLVPYCVATYGAVSYRLHRAPPVSAAEHEESKHAAT